MAAVEDLAVMVDGVVAVGENRQEPAVAERPAGEDAEAVIGGGTGEIHEDKVGEVGGSAGSACSPAAVGASATRTGPAGARSVGENRVYRCAGAGRDGGGGGLVADQRRPVGRDRRRLRRLRCAPIAVTLARALAVGRQALIVRLVDQVCGQVDAAPVRGQKRAVDRAQQPDPPALADSGGWGRPHRRGHRRPRCRAVGAGNPGSSRAGPAGPSNVWVIGVQGWLALLHVIASGNPVLTPRWPATRKRDDS